MQSDIFKEIGSGIDVERIIQEIKVILTVTDFQDNQIALQYSETENWSEGITNKTEQLPFEEYTYVKWHSFLDGFYMKQLLTDVGFQTAHARIMRLPPKTCYTTHVDYYTRYHIPVTSKPLQSFMVFPDKNLIARMYPGNMYWTNTYELHTFVNGTFEDRIHIVFNNAAESKNLDNDYLRM